MYITEPPASAQSYTIRVDPVPLIITYDAEFVLTEKVSLYPSDSFNEGLIEFGGGPLQWTTKEGSGAAGLLFTRPNTKQEFGVLFGIYDDETFWSEIVEDLNSGMTLEDELMDRYPPLPRERFGRGAGRVYDRVRVQTPGGECVKLAAKRCIIAFRPGYKIEITVFVDKEHQYTPRH
jgi:hypothetical protein